MRKNLHAVWLYDIILMYFLLWLRWNITFEGRFKIYNKSKIRKCISIKNILNIKNVSIKICLNANATLGSVQVVFVVLPHTINILKRVGERLLNKSVYTPGNCIPIQQSVRPILRVARPLPRQTWIKITTHTHSLTSRRARGAFCYTSATPVSCQ